MGDITVRDAGKVLLKELGVSLIVNVGVGLLTFGRVMTMQGGSLMIALTVVTALSAIVVLSKLLGGLLHCWPTSCAWIRADGRPADHHRGGRAGLIIYFTAAKLLLRCDGRLAHAAHKNQVRCCAAGTFVIK